MLLAMLGLRDVEGVSAAIQALSEECGSVRDSISSTGLRSRASGSPPSY